MRKAIALVVTLVLAAVAGSSVCADVGVEIQVAPHTLLLGFEQGLLTVHADIAYGLVATNSLTLNGVPASFAFPDSCGNLVAKFPESGIKDAYDENDPPSTDELTLAGLKKSGEAFSGTDTVLVKVWQGTTR